MKTALPAVAVVVGVVLLSLSLAWSIFFPASAVWTTEKSTQMTELGNQATALKLQMQSQSKPSMHAGQNQAELKEKYDQVSAEYKILYDEFRSAKDSPQTSSSILRWAGIAFIAAGAMVVMATRNG